MKQSKIITEVDPYKGEKEVINALAIGTPIVIWAPYDSEGVYCCSNSVSGEPIKYLLDEKNGTKIFWINNCDEEIIELRGILSDSSSEVRKDLYLPNFLFPSEISGWDEKPYNDISNLSFVLRNHYQAGDITKGIGEIAEEHFKKILSIKSESDVFEILGRQNIIVNYLEQLRIKRNPERRRSDELKLYKLEQELKWFDNLY